MPSYSLKWGKNYKDSCKNLQCMIVKKSEVIKNKNQMDCQVMIGKIPILFPLLM